MTSVVNFKLANNSSETLNFYFFQQPPVFSGGNEAYVNSLYTASLPPNALSGEILQFSIDLQYYAGAQRQVAPPTIGQLSGLLSTIQPINLSFGGARGQQPNATMMAVQPSLQLQSPVVDNTVETGPFRIVTPAFEPGEAYNIGAALKIMTGEIVLSSFVSALPSKNLDCLPIPIFYVGVGTYAPGTVLDFTSSSASAGVCDLNTGYTSFDVSFNADGIWTVQTDGWIDRPLLPDQTLNVEILDEAGTAVICRGFAAGFNLPITIQNLTNPGDLQMNARYQIRPVGRQDVIINGNTATFF